MCDDTSSNNALTTIRITRRTIGRWRRENAAPRGICAVRTRNPREDAFWGVGRRISATRTPAARASGVPTTSASREGRRAPGTLSSLRSPMRSVALRGQSPSVHPRRPCRLPAAAGVRVAEMRCPTPQNDFPSEPLTTVTVVRAVHLALPLLSELARVRKKTGISALSRIVSSRLLLPEGPQCVHKDCSVRNIVAEARGKLAGASRLAPRASQRRPCTLSFQPARSGASPTRVRYLQHRKGSKAGVERSHRDGG